MKMENIYSIPEVDIYIYLGGDEIVFPMSGYVR
jgi:hypothetical protein